MKSYFIFKKKRKFDKDETRFSLITIFFSPSFIVGEKMFLRQKWSNIFLEIKIFWPTLENFHWICLVWSDSRIKLAKYVHFKIGQLWIESKIHTLYIKWEANLKNSTIIECDLTKTTKFTAAIQFGGKKWLLKVGFIHLNKSLFYFNCIEMFNDVQSKSIFCNT